MDKNAVLNSLTLLAQAYAFAKDGNEKMAGKLFVEAAANDNLDEVMDGVAQGADEIANDNSTPAPKLDNEGIPEEDDSSSDTTEVSASVELPESVARLAARTLV